jgi:hypothetical protein
MRRLLDKLPLAAAVIALAVPAPALASSDDVIRDCAQDGSVDGKYSDRELQQAERDLPNDIDEYTDCRAAIRAAQGGGSGRAHGTPSSGSVTESGAVASSPEDVAALEKLTSGFASGKRGPVTVGGEAVLPGNAGLSGVLSGVAGANALPLPLALAMATIVLLAVVTVYLAARDRMPGVRRAALRIFSR